MYNSNNKVCDWPGVVMKDRPECDETTKDGDVNKKFPGKEKTKLNKPKQPAGVGSFATKETGNTSGNIEDKRGFTISKVASGAANQLISQEAPLKIVPGIQQPLGKMEQREKEGNITASKIVKEERISAEEKTPHQESPDASYWTISRVNPKITKKRPGRRIVIANENKTKEANIERLRNIGEESMKISEETLASLYERREYLREMKQRITEEENKIDSLLQYWNQNKGLTSSFLINAHSNEAILGKTNQQTDSLKEGKRISNIFKNDNTSALLCPPSWQSIGSKCFYLSAGNVATSWMDAKNRCMKMKEGATLASISNTYELDMVIGLSGLVSPSFIGATDLKSRGTWDWIDRTGWSWGGEESEGNTEARCLEMVVKTSREGLKMAGWSGVNCDKIIPQNYICSFFTDDNEISKKMFENRPNRDGRRRQTSGRGPRKA